MNSFQFVPVSFMASFETLWIVPCLFWVLPYKKWKWFIWQNIAYTPLVVGCILFFRKKSQSGAIAYNPGCILQWIGMPHVEWSNQSIVPKLNSPSHEWALHIHERPRFFPFVSFKCSFACIISKRAQQVKKQNQRPQTTVEKMYSYSFGKHGSLHTS